MAVSLTNSASVASTQRAMRTEQTQQTQQAQQRQTEQQPVEARAVTPPPATPVINTQGQTTGRLLNVTA